MAAQQKVSGCGGGIEGTDSIIQNIQQQIELIIKNLSKAQRESEQILRETSKISRRLNFVFYNLRI